jgi:NAD-dependent dihydropyrimidine dehydrogenase PreA subunit
MERAEDGQMAFVITEPCIDTTSGECVDVCPVDCIHFDANVDRKMYIDPDECIDCGACEAACPERAIFAEGKVPSDSREFIALDAQWYRDPESVRARIDLLRPAAA